jgi:hypothetical protein
MSGFGTWWTGMARRGVAVLFHILTRVRRPNKQAPDARGISRHRAQVLLLAVGLAIHLCRGDTTVEGPTRPLGSVPAPTDVGIPLRPPGGRYQQVYNASLFSSVDRSLIYVTTLKFNTWINRGEAYVTIQVNLSTTPRAADGLSQTFADNVGADDTKVLGPARIPFTGPQIVPLDRPFRYDPIRGNLLVDMRVLSVDAPSPGLDYPALWGSNLSTDEVSRVWATNVVAITATTADTIGPYFDFQFSAIPSLRIYTSFFGTPTNFVAIEWPTQPTVFQFQNSFVLGSGANWQPATGGLLFSNYAYQRYYFPANTAGPRKFYRLVWPSGP